MKYPMVSTVVSGDEYPYHFSFDLIEHGPKPKDQIPELKRTVYEWLGKSNILEFKYKAGLFWCLKNERDAMLFELRFA